MSWIRPILLALCGLLVLLAASPALAWTASITSPNYVTVTRSGADGGAATVSFYNRVGTPNWSDSTQWATTSGWTLLQTFGVPATTGSVLYSMSSPTGYSRMVVCTIAGVSQYIPVASAATAQVSLSGQGTLVAVPLYVSSAPATVAVSSMPTDSPGSVVTSDAPMPVAVMTSPTDVVLVVFVWLVAFGLFFLVGFRAVGA